MNHLPSPENYGDLHLEAIRKELFDMIQLKIVIMFLGFGPESEFFKLNGVLLFLGRLNFFRLLVKIFAVIHDSAYRRSDIGGNLNKIQSTAGCDFQRLVGRYDAYLCAVFIDQSDLRDPNAPINPGCRFVSYILSSVLQLQAVRLNSIRTTAL